MWYTAETCVKFGRNCTTEKPDHWLEKYKRAKDYYIQLRRPDGSLPAFGDYGNSREAAPLVDGWAVLTDNLDHALPQKKAHSLYPVAGYSIWWDGLDSWPDTQKLAQTTVAWSYFPGHAHKHADEMSVMFWASGQTWWTNVGYWPYGVRGRSEAKSWNGSNAPHLVNESAKSPRSTKLTFPYPDCSKYGC